MRLNYTNFTALRHMCKEEKNRADYLPKDINNPSEVSKSQKNYAKKAILWLLSKAPHTVDEIAEHYALSPELVKFLLKDFIRSRMLTMDTDQLRYQTVRQAP